MRPPLRRGDGPALGGARAYRERSASALAFRKPCARERFAGYAPHPQLLDTHDESVAQQKLSFLRRRSKVVEIVGARDLIFGLTLSGVCAVFDRAKRQRCAPAPGATPGSRAPLPTPAAPPHALPRRAASASSTRVRTR